MISNWKEENIIHCEHSKPAQRCYRLHKIRQVTLAVHQIPTL